MRLWHVDLIPVLPRQQLLAQWRECVLIAKNLANDFTPNHILVNKVTKYPAWHFENYCELVRIEMNARGYKTKEEVENKLNLYLYWYDKRNDLVSDSKKIFEDWHNKRYLLQCFYNLQEKYDCGGITEEEYTKLTKRVVELVDKFNKMEIESNG